MKIGNPNDQVSFAPKCAVGPYVVLPYLRRAVGVDVREDARVPVGMDGPSDPSRSVSHVAGLAAVERPLRDDPAGRAPLS